MDNLNSHILKTLALFDIFSRPLTDFEIWQYLTVPASYSEVRRVLENNEVNFNLENQYGFFYLPNRSDIIETRRQRYSETDKKLKIAQRRLLLISWLPWIKLICLANNIGSRNIRREGDLDLFIITSANRIWLTKLLTTTILALSGLRPTEKRFQNKLCLSFLVDETKLNLESILLSDDPYVPCWLAGLMPLRGDWNVYLKLMDNNLWLKKSLPNLVYPETASKYFIQSRIRKSPKNSFNFLEVLAKKFHKKIMSKKILSQAGQNSSVIIEDHIIKLHTEDRREKFREALKERLEKYA